MKLSTLLDPRFRAALSKLQNEPVPLKAAFKLRSLVKAMERELTTYEETRQAALLKYGRKNEDGTLMTSGDNKNVEFDDGMLEKFLLDLKDLTNVTVNLPKINAADLGNATVSADDLAMLEDFLEF